LGGETPDNAGMILDFGILKRHLKDILATLDHKCLNDDVEFFKNLSPSSEHIARYIFANLKEKLSSNPVKILEVKVFESENSYAIYSE